MKKSKIAVAVFAAIMATTSFARAEGFGQDFDGRVDKKGEISLQEAFKTASESSGIPIPAAPARIYYGDAEPGLIGIAASNKVPKIYLMSRQLTLKHRILDYIAANGNNTDMIGLIKKDDTKILFDAGNVYVASGDYSIYLTLTDPELIGKLGLDRLVNAKTRGKCHWVKTLLKQCGAWGNGICITWQLIEIWNEVCDPIPTTPSDNPGGEVHNCITEGTC